MKATKQVTVTENLCDTCKAPVEFSGQQCIVCGKHKCQKCDDMQFLDFKGPKYFGFADYAPDVPHVRACPGCRSEITRGMKKLKQYMEMWANDRNFHATRYNNLAKKVARLVEVREREIESL